jgi:hypothetical protein
MADNLNLSDRKIIRTRRDGSGKTDFRLPDVPLVGAEITAATEEVPDSGFPSDPGVPVVDKEVGVPSDLVVEEQLVRVQADGTAVVDVVISYVPADGARSHEMRITKL